jgi:hypothetical protein
MKKTTEKLIQDLIKNIGHPMFFEGYSALMRDEKKHLYSEVQHDFRKLKRNISQKFGVLIGCVISFCFNTIWLIFIPPVKLFQIIKKMFSIPSKVKEHQKLINSIKSHPDFQRIEEEYLKLKKH